jgi:hypothetical protein
VNSRRPLHVVAVVFHTLAVLAAVAGAIVTIQVASIPFGDLGGHVWMMLVWSAAGLIWLASLVIGLTAGRAKPLLIVPAIAALSLAIWWSDVPVKVRVAMSDTALTNYVEAIERDDVGPPERWSEESIVVGHVEVLWVEELGGRPHLVTGFAGSDEPAGLVRLPEAPTNPRSTYEHLHGSWYLWWPPGWR